jgi:hypothetical protein
MLLWLPSMNFFYMCVVQCSARYEQREGLVLKKLLTVLVSFQQRHQLLLDGLGCFLLFTHIPTAWLP